MSDAMPAQASYELGDMLTAAVPRPQHRAALEGRQRGLRRTVHGDHTNAHRGDAVIPQRTPARFPSGPEHERAYGSEPQQSVRPSATAVEVCRCHPRADQGFTIFLTGLSGAGKSTIANSLCSRLLDHSGRHVTLLDGDLVRQHLASELGFSRADRDRNVLRVGFVAAEITKHRGIAVCALIAPFDSTRREVRRMVEEGGGFILVHVATPLDICESRDRKGLYAKARAGLLPQFTGITDPYEVPTNADLVIDTRKHTAESATQMITDYLEESGFLANADHGVQTRNGLSADQAGP